MQKFKILVSKQGKNFTFVLSAENEQKARERIHKEGYSILSIEEISDISNFGHQYIFEAEKNGNKKNGKIIGDDIFKAYIKLRKNLGYTIFAIYEESNKEINDLEKNKILKELEEEYNIYIKSFSKKIEKKEEKKEKIDVKDLNFENENFYLKKDLEETYKLIDYILEKIKNLIDGKNINNLKIEDKEKLKNIYNSIIKIKTTTNILKLKEIGEKALEKIGELELKDLEQNKNKKTKKLLTDTNFLLKKIGSHKTFVEKKYDVNYYLDILKQFFNNYFYKSKNNIVEKSNEKIDKESYYYIKNQLLLNKYIDKLKENKRNILKNLFKKEKREELILKNKVIKQNIVILKAKIKGVSFSYTFLKKGYDNFFKIILVLFKQIKVSLFYIIILYSLFFIIVLNFSYYFDVQFFNYNGVKYLIYILILYYILNFSKNTISIIINFILYYFIILYFIINF